jgi:hypothetical protein
VDWLAKKIAEHGHSSFDWTRNILPEPWGWRRALGHGVCRLHIGACNRWETGCQTHLCGVHDVLRAFAPGISPCLLETGEELCWMIVSLFSLLEKVAVDVLQVKYRVCTGKALPELAAREICWRLTHPEMLKRGGGEKTHRRLKTLHCNLLTYSLMKLVEFSEKPTH